jgi:hypothetical protein
MMVEGNERWRTRMIRCECWLSTHSELSNPLDLIFVSQLTPSILLLLSSSIIPSSQSFLSSFLSILSYPTLPYPILSYSMKWNEAKLSQVKLSQVKSVVWINSTWHFNDWSTLNSLHPSHRCRFYRFYRFCRFNDSVVLMLHLLQNAIPKLPCSTNTSWPWTLLFSRFTSKTWSLIKEVPYQHFRFHFRFQTKTKTKTITLYPNQPKPLAEPFQTKTLILTITITFTDHHRLYYTRLESTMTNHPSFDPFGLTTIPT